ncbi:MAG TPA: hypothetical protein VEP90_23510, partial [Methylomirabilota bacterium]|nr:hypothetical protein [Methylomirabilota bacterium]
NYISLSMSRNDPSSLSHSPSFPCRQLAIPCRLYLILRHPKIPLVNNPVSMSCLLLLMKKQPLIKKLHKPVSPIISITAIVGVVLLAVIVLFILHASQNSSSVVQPTVAYSTPTPPLTPMPIDTSTWKTYTDWKYGYSVKLPPEFYSYIPGKGATGATIDPEGNGFVQFEDGTLSGDYPNRTSKYGFYVRIEKGTPRGSNCTTDQECLNLIRGNVGRTTGTPLHARFLNRDIEGVALVNSSPNRSSPTGEDLSVYYEYPFIANGLVFNAEISFYYPKSFQQTQTKEPVINAILSSLSFPNQ